MKCILCGGEERENLPDLARSLRPPFSTGISKCRNCGLCNLDPMPTMEEVTQYYTSGAFSNAYGDVMSPHCSNATESRPRLVRRLQKMEKWIGGPGRILDVGAGDATFLSLARERGWNIVGIEPDPAGVDKARKRHGIELRNCILEEAGFEQGSFDAVHMSHVLEHMLRPDETLQVLSSLLRRGGVMGLEVPNELGQISTLIKEVVLRRVQPVPVPAPHTFFFSAKTLTGLVEKAGYQRIVCTTPHYTDSYESRIPLGGIVKRIIHPLEEALRKGPLIALLAQNP